MSADHHAGDLLDLAAGHLHAAADKAETLGSDDAFSDWHDLASQARLTASGVSHSPRRTATPDTSLTAELTAALRVLDTVPIETGPPDLLLWAWHIRELRNLAERMERR
jgi:hypothetical protein